MIVIASEQENRVYAYNEKKEKFLMKQEHYITIPIVR